MRYEFHPAALEEYHQAALWYAERAPQVGLKFVASVEEAIAVMHLSREPGYWKSRIAGK